MCTSQSFITRLQWLWIFVVITLICNTRISHAFSPPRTTITSLHKTFLLAKQQRGEYNGFSSSDNINEHAAATSKNYHTRHTPSHRYQEKKTHSESLSVMIARYRMEERHTHDLFSSEQRHITYQMCRSWVHAQNDSGHQWRNKREWDKWIDNGEKKSFYIPSQPEEYYTKCGTWISWKDFLGIDDCLSLKVAHQVSHMCEKLFTTESNDKISC